MSSARLFYAEGYEVGVGQAYGHPMYGTIGFGIGLTPGFPMFHTGLFSEIEERIDARVTRAWGADTYGSFLVRQAKAPFPVEAFRIEADEVYAPELIEDETLDVSLRVAADGIHCFEFSEVAWQG